MICCCKPDVSLPSNCIVIRFRARVTTYSEICLRTRASIVPICPLAAAVKRSISVFPSVKIVLFTCFAVTSASFPMDSIIENKLWPSVRRVDDAFGDRNLICSCISIEEYM